MLTFFTSTANHSCKRILAAPRTKCTQECSPLSGCNITNNDCVFDGQCCFSCIEKSMCSLSVSSTDRVVVVFAPLFNCWSFDIIQISFWMQIKDLCCCLSKQKVRDLYKSKFGCWSFVLQTSLFSEKTERKMSFLGSQAVNLMFLCFSFWLSDMSCGDPPDVNNGFREFNSTGYNSTATYTCNKGYGLNSKNAVKRCTAKKKWEGLKPRCRKSAFAYLSQMLKVWPSRP